MDPITDTALITYFVQAWIIPYIPYTVIKAKDVPAGKPTWSEDMKNTLKTTFGRAGYITIIVLMLTGLEVLVMTMNNSSSTIGDRCIKFCKFITWGGLFIFNIVLFCSLGLIIWYLLHEIFQKLDEYAPEQKLKTPWNLRFFDIIFGVFIILIFLFKLKPFTKKIDVVVPPIISLGDMPPGAMPPHAKVE